MGRLIIVIVATVAAAAAGAAFAALGGEVVFQGKGMKYIIFCGAVGLVGSIYDQFIHQNNSSSS